MTGGSSGPTARCSREPHPRHPPCPSPPYEQVLIDSIFAGGNQIACPQLKNRFKPTLDAVERLMYEEVVRRGWFRRSPERARAGGWTGLGTLLIFGSVFAAFFLGGMLSGLFADSTASRSRRRGCSSGVGVVSG